MRPFLRAIGESFLRHKLIRHPNRTYLSSTFSCDEAWESRLNHKIFQQVNSEVMYYDLDGAYNKTKKLAAVDIDVFVNAQKDDSFITEVEELLYKLRLTAETSATLPTTHHAVIRLFLKLGRVEDLVRILYDRLNYGIFPDYYCTLLLLDYLLKKGDFRHAAKIAALDMFQEDYSHDLVRLMSLFAIHKYLLTDQLWNDPLPPPVENDEDEEEIKVRVLWVRNPYFDNHFDLDNGNHICGKSLLMISSKIEGPIRQSYKLMGLTLYNLWDKLEAELVDLSSRVKNQSDPILYADALEFTCNFVKENLTDSGKQNKILELINQIDSHSCIQESLLTTVENEMKNLIEKREKNEIQTQEKVSVLLNKRVKILRFFLKIMAR